MKKVGIFILLILMVGCAAQKAQISDSSPITLDSQLQELTDQIVLSLSQQQKSKIAIIEFSDLNGNVTQFGKFLAEELTTRLFLTGKFEVIERQMLNKVMEEHQLTLSGMIDESSAKELGKILGVDAIATGSISDLGKYVKVNARLISTESGNVFSVASVKILKDNEVRMLMGSKIAITTKTEQQSAEPPPNKVIEKEGFRIELQKCTMSDRTVVCSLLVTNTTEDDKDFEITFGWQYQTAIFDNMGNEYVISSVTFANQNYKIKGLSCYSGAKKKIVAGTSVETKLYFEKVSSKATGISLLQLLCGYRGFKVEFRKIELIK